MMKAGCPTGTIRDKSTNICVVKKEHLKPMVCWPGGKSRVSKQIVKKIPEHKVYVEPFMGGAVSISRNHLHLTGISLMIKIRI